MEHEEIMLSVLMCTIPSRSGNFASLMIKTLTEQAKGKPVEILWLGDNKKRSIGQKRNALVRLAQGKYICFVDDDDRIHKNYIEVLLAATKSNADCICFKEFRTENLFPDKEVHFSKDFENKELDSFYLRMPHHRMPIKRELVLQVSFENINFGEDTAFARAINPLLQTQFSIPAVLYWYDYDKDISEAKI